MYNQTVYLLHLVVYSWGMHYQIHGDTIYWIIFQNTFHCLFFLYIHSYISVLTLYSILTLSFALCFLLPPRPSVLNILYLYHMWHTVWTGPSLLPPEEPGPCKLWVGSSLLFFSNHLPDHWVTATAVLHALLHTTTEKKTWAQHFWITNQFS